MITLEKTETIEGIELLLLGFEEEVERKRELSDIEKEIELKDYKKELLNQNLSFFVIKNDQIPVGIVSYSIRENGNGKYYADFSRFYIAAEHRKKGIRKMTEETLKLFFKKSGIRYMKQAVESTNADYIATLKRNGYMWKERYYDEKERREWLVYIKIIQNGRNRKSE